MFPSTRPIRVFAYRHPVGVSLAFPSQRDRVLPCGAILGRFESTRAVEYIPRTFNFQS